MQKVERIARTIREHQAVTKETFTAQAAPLILFAEQVAGAFQQGNRLLVCGTGCLAAIADLTATRFLHRLALERPSLPALSFGHDTTLATALAREGQSRQFFARQLRSIGTDGDVLLVFADLQPDPALTEVLAEAIDLGCVTAALVPGAQDLQPHPPEHLFRLETASAARAAEAALFFGQLLCELVEGELFGT